MQKFRCEYMHQLLLRLGFKNRVRKERERKGKNSVHHFELGETNFGTLYIFPLAQYCFPSTPLWFSRFWSGWILRTAPVWMRFIFRLYSSLILLFNGLLLKLSLMLCSIRSAGRFRWIMWSMLKITYSVLTSVLKKCSLFYGGQRILIFYKTFCIYVWFLI